MCPDCSRLQAQNIYLLRCKQEADKVIALLYIEYTADTQLSRLIKRARDEYESITAHPGAPESGQDANATCGG